MLFHVRMDVKIPHDLDPIRADELKRVERERAQDLQKQGKWPSVARGRAIFERQPLQRR